MKVWILTIDNEYGASASAYSNEQACIDHLYAYVQEWWDDVAEILEEECPDDKQEAIKLYFDDHPKGEWANIEEVTVSDKYQ